MKIGISSAVIFLSLFFISSMANATWLAITLAQPKADSLKGWKIYHAVHVNGEEPTPAVSKDVNDGLTEWVGFTGANEIMPMVDRQWGVRIKPYEGYPTYWEVELTFYLPGTKPENNETVHFIATATKFDNTETDASPAYPFPVEAPGQPSIPEFGYQRIESEDMVNQQMSVQSISTGIDPGQVFVPDGKSSKILSVREIKR